MTSKWHSTTWIIASSTSCWSHFGLVKRKKMILSACNHYKRRFYEFTQEEFWLVHRPKWVQSDMRALETSLFRFQPSRILGSSRRRKWVFSAWRPLETPLSRLNQSRIFGLSRGRKWLLNDKWPLDYTLYRLENGSIFGWSRTRKWLQSEFGKFNHRFFYFILIAFWAGQEAENDSQCLTTTLKVAFMNSPTSHSGQNK